VAAAALAPSRLRERLWRLLAWCALVGAGLAVFWRWVEYQDYRNTGVVVAALLVMFGASLWLLRNSGGTRWQRRMYALTPWAPLALLMPRLGPVELVWNGNVGVESWRWRYSRRPDERLAGVDATGPAIKLKTTPFDYPAFLGGGYWPEIHGVALDSDWSARPPQKIWRQPIGAGWSGFAVVGDYAFTQEQRGPDEMVVCYELQTGRIAWAHKDPVRWDPSGSAGLGKVGPRATPTVFDGRVYAQGATGILNCLDAATGAVVWSHDTIAEERAEIVMWGKAGSPLIVDDLVVLSVGGSDDNSLVAYDRKTGRRAWGGGSRQSSYATPVLATLGGQRQIVLVNEDFITAHRVTDGRVLWEYPFPGNSGSNASASQPVPIGDDRLLLTKGYSVPAEVIQVRGAGDQWTATRVWQHPVMRTKFSTVVVRNGYAYGIDDVDLACIDLATGRRKWKSRRRPEAGNGQVMLVGDAIVVSCESGEVVLVAANPKKYVELGAFRAIGDNPDAVGVAWNTPALAGPYLLVRNDEEAACYQLPLAARPDADSAP
jgi:outer membrane protein assembly factor BamB